MPDLVKQERESFGQAFKDLIGGRPVGIICQGPTLKDFNCGDLDFCWGAINNYQLSEVALGRPLDFVIAYNPDFHRINPGCLTFRHAPCRGYNSLHEFLLWCIEIEISEIVLFGADGYGGYVDGIDRPNVHHKDCEALNRDFPDDTGKTRIRNCSPGSKYTKFPIASYEEMRNQ